ncbi:MAG: tyrosine--tRNA ligase [Patescibacteria group bacterium]
MKDIKTDKTSITNFLERSVENAYPNKEEFAKALASGKQLTAYLGIDPTGPSLHLGHAIEMRKLRELQDMGHRVILLIGDFTAMIGDPTDKSAARVKLTREQVLENCKNYREQAGMILDMDGKQTGNPVEMKFNSEWLGAMSFADVLELASQFTVQQMLERDMFARRMKENPPKPIYIHEFMYPLMQGYDSVAMDVDIEIGGNDQTFNMLAGRDLMKALKNKEKFVLTCKLLTDPGGKKMGKSEGNMITLGDKPEDMFGKVMSWTDGMIAEGFELCTSVPGEEIDAIVEKMEDGENPVAFKRQLASRIVTEWFNAESAKAAEEHFDKLFKQHAAPENMPEVRVKGDRHALVDLLIQSKLVTSKSDARRQITQGAVKVDGQPVTDEGAELEITGESVVLQKGKRHFAKIIKN